GVRPRELLVVDRLLGGGASAPAVFGGPLDPGPACLRLIGLPCASHGKDLVVGLAAERGTVAPVGGKVRGQPRPEIGAELLVGRREAQIHSPTVTESDSVCA